MGGRRMLALPVLAVLALGLASGTAAASTASAPAQSPALAAAPDCVESWVDGYTAEARNDCSTSKRIKFTWALAPDSSCRTIRSGSSSSHTISNPLAYFTGIESC
ncbi:hypothetical protein [Nocardiopsis trehalosi]|uniref:hypothetical protein n=1 Tax=Nocardiopsis trehalosi TaxID=109329 RepID=UPI0012F82762|nr:hypothetical protein [Nocardiopsis trehalosi]